MMRSIARVSFIAACVCLVAVPARAQLRLQGIGGVTDAAARAPFYAGSLGLGVSFVEFDVEGGRFQDVMPKGVLDAIHQLEMQHGLPVQAIASVPATYAMGDIRLIAPHGVLRPFVAGGLGVAHLEPQIDVSVEGISLGDIFGLTDFQAQTKTMAMASAGLRVALGPADIEGGYRYVVIYSHFQPDTNFNNDHILTTVNAVYGAVGLKF